MNEKFLNNLLTSISVSGFEEPVQDIVEEEMKECADESIFRKRSGASSA